MSLVLVVLIFIASGIAIVVSSTRIVRYGEIVANKTRMGQLWVGATMIAAVTSLPEAATDISAALLDAPNLAAGDLFGSSLTNMLIFAILSIWFAGLWKGHRVSKVEWITWAVAMLVTTEAMFFIIFDAGLQILAIGSGGILITISYLAGARMVFKYSATPKHKTLALDQMGKATQITETSLLTAAHSIRQALVRFVGWASVVLITAPLLALTSEELATATGLGNTFFGVIVLAALTSLPELAASIEAFRRNLPSIVFGNLLGSNALNMLIIFAVDISFTEAPFLQSIAKTHALAALEGIAMMAAVMGGVFLLSRSKELVGKAVLGVTVIFYVGSIASIYTHST